MSFLLPRILGLPVIPELLELLFVFGQRCYKCHKSLRGRATNIERNGVDGAYLIEYDGGEFYRRVETLGEMISGEGRFECEQCFHKPFRDQEARRRQEALTQRLQESHRRAKQQHERATDSLQLQQHQSTPEVLVHHQRVGDRLRDGAGGQDHLLRVLSQRSGISSLCVPALEVDELEEVLEVLQSLLFDEWVAAPPPRHTLDHAQVYITEIYVWLLFRQDSAETTSERLQSAVASLSRSAGDVRECLLLAQALYGTLRDPPTLSPPPYAQEEPPPFEQMAFAQFLSALAPLLQSAIDQGSEMGLQCLRLLLSALTWPDMEEAHPRATQTLLRLVRTNGWSPAEAAALLQTLSQNLADHSSVAGLLLLVQVYHLSPSWTDDSGRSLVQAAALIRSEQDHRDFRETLRRKDAESLNEALGKLKMIWGLTDSMTDMIQRITSGVLQRSQKADGGLTVKGSAPLPLLIDFMQRSLFQLCEAVFFTKGWWPTVRQMLRLCLLVLTAGHNGPLLLVGLDEDPCVLAMFVASVVLFAGNKMDVVLGQEFGSKEQMDEWTDFYKHLGISVDTNTKKASSAEVYGADVVFGGLEDFVCDYLGLGLHRENKGNIGLRHRFIMAEGCLSAACHLDLSKLSDSLVFAGELLQGLLGQLQQENLDVKHKFVEALFDVLHSHLRANTAHKTGNILKRTTGESLPLREVFTLSFFESLLINCHSQSKTSAMSKWCMESLVACVDKFHPSKEETKLVFRMVSELCQNLWPPGEALHLVDALASNHHDQGCVPILRILHLLITHQLSSKWTDEDNRSLFELVDSYGSMADLICHLKKTLEDEKPKSITALVDEIRRSKDMDEQTLAKAQSVVAGVIRLIQTGDIKRHNDVRRAHKLSRSVEEEHLQEVLAVLCNGVHLTRAQGKWWPRATQMLSWCLLALSPSGRLLEMGTGEGKSCVIAMFAALNALRGQKVDVVSSSPVLCQRDVEEWRGFYQFFGLTVDTNTDKTRDEERKRCYGNDVVYGTIDTFAADHLRQIFEMKDVRPGRGFQCVVVDEVDSLLLDQGVQLTYLSSPMVSMQHLNVVLAMIWAHVGTYGFLSTGHQRFVQGPPASFFKVIFDSMGTETAEIQDPLHLLRIAEGLDTVPPGFAEEMSSCGKDELVKKLSTVSQGAMLDFFEKLEDYIPYEFSVYTLDDGGWLRPRKRGSGNESTPQLSFLVLGEGLCCPLYEGEDAVIQAVAELISDKIQYTPCDNRPDRISVPGFLKALVAKKLPLWVENAFLAKRLQEGEEYVVVDDKVCPVDFQSTGTVELNKKWGDGLQQFVEMKHQIKLSALSAVTNYMSNISFFQKYEGNIFGATRTLGGQSDMACLHELYPNLSMSKMPTSNRKKLFEVKGTLTMSPEEWKSQIKAVVMAQTSPQVYRGGRAALVICETINKAKEICKELRDNTRNGKIILYCRSDTDDSDGTLQEEMRPGDVMVATNLAGRGTDIKVSQEVNGNGGLLVVLSFLSENARVELQAFGRTARKGKPGSAQIVVCSQHLPEPLRAEATSLQRADKSARDRFAAQKTKDMMGDVTELKLREDLFSQYLEALHHIHSQVDGEEKQATVAVINEFWGIWLQMKTEEIEQLKRSQLQSDLEVDLLSAKEQCRSQTSPCSSIYHYIKFGNIAMKERRWAAAAGLFEKAMKQDKSWAAVAFYSHAYCTIQQGSEDYLSKAREDLQRAQQSLNYLCEDSTLCLQFVRMSRCGGRAQAGSSSLEKQLTAKSGILTCLDQNISQAIQKLEQIKEKGGGANVQKSSITSLVSTGDQDLQEEAYNLFDQGLKYVFTVEGEPCFQWEALLLAGLGVAQIAAGVFLTVTTLGTFYTVGLELITEGIQECIHAVHSMVRGEFSWKTWITNKAISIGMSLLMFGVGKLISKGYKAGKAAVGSFFKEAKALPKLLSKQAKDCTSVVMKTNLRNALKHTAKKAVHEVVSYGLGPIEEEILVSIISSVKDQVNERIVAEVESKVGRGPLSSLVDSVILSYLEDDEQLSDLLQNEKTNKWLLDIFGELSQAAVLPSYKHLGWVKNLQSSLTSVMQIAKTDAKGGTRDFLKYMKAFQVGAMVVHATCAVGTLSSSFFSNFQQELETFQKGHNPAERPGASGLAHSERQMLSQFKKNLAASMSTLLSDAFVEVFHQTVSSYVISYAKGKLNQYLIGTLRDGLQSQQTEDALLMGQHNRFLAYMPLDAVSGSHFADEDVIRLVEHAQRLQDPMSKGTVLESRILSEQTNTKVIILTEDGQGGLQTMQQLTPDSCAPSRTVELIYRPKSDRYPEGHYDVRINNHTVRVDGEGSGCLFHALARGMNPDAGKGHVAQEAKRLRSSVSQALHANLAQWQSFVRRQSWLNEIRGHWFLGKRGRVQRVKETEEILRKEVGKVGRYEDLQKHTHIEGIGSFINADHQPPVSSVVKAYEMNQNSPLAVALLEVATGTSHLDPLLIKEVKTKHGPRLLAVYVPKQLHYQFLSTTCKDYREYLAEQISRGNVVDTFKLMFLGSMPRCQLSDGNNCQNSQNDRMSRIRLDVFNKSFPKHSKKLAETWYGLLRDKGVMTGQDLCTITEWIDNEGYRNQNDPHRQKVSSFVKRCCHNTAPRWPPPSTGRPQLGQGARAGLEPGPGAGHLIEC